MLLAATFAILLLPAPLVALGFPLSLPALVAAAFLAGVGSEVFGLLWHTTMQQEIPADKLSRVYSYDALGSIALVPVGYALAGPVGRSASGNALGRAALGVAVTLAVLFVSSTSSGRPPLPDHRSPGRPPRCCCRRHRARTHRSSARGSAL